MILIRSSDVYSSKQPVNVIAEGLAASNRFGFIEALRVGALEALQHSIAGQSGSDIRLNLADAESQAMQRQFERIDSVVVGTLDKDGTRREYDAYAPAVDVDLPADPRMLADPVIAYRYAVMRLYRRQFDVTMEHDRKDGCWPLVCYDLLDPIDGKRSLIVNDVPQSVREHASTEFLKDMDLPSLRRMRNVFGNVKADALRRIDQLGKGGPEVFLTAAWGRVIKILIGIAEAAGVIDGVISLYERAREKFEAAQHERERVEREKQEAEAKRQEKAAKEHWQRELRERSIPEGSGHMELFEKNRERIGGMC